MEQLRTDSVGSSELHRCRGGAGRVRVSIGDECLQCGLCLDQCPVRAIVVNCGRYAVGGGCRGCASCAEVCPAGAIRLIFDDGR